MSQNKKYDFGWRVPFSIIIGVCWLIFVILWLAFFASNYSVYQNVSVGLTSILIVFLLLGGFWAYWGLKMVPREAWLMMKITGLRWRIYLSIIIPFAAMFFLCFWFFFEADIFTIYQNIAVLLVTILIMGAVLVVFWSRWKKSYNNIEETFEKIGKEFENTFKNKEEEE